MEGRRERGGGEGGEGGDGGKERDREGGERGGGRDGEGGERGGGRDGGKERGGPVRETGREGREGEGGMEGRRERGVRKTGSLREEGEGGTFITQYSSTVHIGMSMGPWALHYSHGYKEIQLFNLSSRSGEYVQKSNCKQNTILETGKNMIFSELSMFINAKLTNHNSKNINELEVLHVNWFFSELVYVKKLIYES